jgi:archaeosine-15-forming tRNA-guanine transglycosylase
MKVLDILLEAKLKPSDFYQENRLEALIYMLEKGQPFTMLDGTSQVIKASRQELRVLKSLRSYYDAGGMSQDVKDYIPREVGGVKLSNIFKTAEFGGKGGVISKDGKSDGVIKSGIGEVVEAMKAAAIFTKLTTRTKTQITADEVIKNLAKVGTNSQEITDGKKISLVGNLTKQVPELAGNIKDNISLEINLARAPFQRVVQMHSDDKDARGRLSSVVNYVNNEADLAKYSRFFASNQRRDPVDIAVKGLAGAKTDVETTYTDQQGRVRPLGHLSMSIKAGSAKYDQASGLNEAGNIKFFNILGLSIDDARDAMKAAKFRNDLEFEPRTKAVIKLYTKAAEKLDQELATLNDKGEATFIKSVLENLKKSIAGDQRLVYVNFDANGTYYKLNPQLINNLVKYVDLDVRLVMRTWPYLYVHDKNTGKDLFHVRLQVNSTGRLTHVFELDNLLGLVKEATDALNLSMRPPSQPQSAVTPPAASASQPTAIKAPIKAKKPAPPAAIEPEPQDDLT